MSTSRRPLDPQDSRVIEVRSGPRDSPFPRCEPLDVPSAVHAFHITGQRRRAPPENTAEAASGGPWERSRFRARGCRRRFSVCLGYKPSPSVKFAQIMLCIECDRRCALQCSSSLRVANGQQELGAGCSTRRDGRVRLNRHSSCVRCDSQCFRAAAPIGSLAIPSVTAKRT
jgi:hypothetical protein